MSEALQQMKQEMIEWGNWSRSAGVMGGLSRGSGFIPNISDDRALEIERIVAAMRHREKKIGRTLYPKGRNAKGAPYVSVIIMRTYINQMTVREMARYYDINRDKIDKMITFGVESIFKALDAANDP